MRSLLPTYPLRERRMDSSTDCGFVLRHALAYAHDILRMVVVNKVTAIVCARKLGLDPDQVLGVAHLLSKLGLVPSRERLALVAMRDPGLDDSDIAEIFSEDESWAAAVRADAARIKAEEPIDWRLETLRGYYYLEDLPPDELYREAEAVRSKRVQPRFNGTMWDLVRLRAFSWNGRKGAFQSLCFPDVV